MVRKVISFVITNTKRKKKDDNSNDMNSAKCLESEDIEIVVMVSEIQVGLVTKLNIVA